VVVANSDRASLFKKQEGDGLPDDLTEGRRRKEEESCINLY
jgi:hypothetical protein